MKTLARISVIMIASVLAACASTTQKNYEACVIGAGTAGVLVGGAAGGVGGVAGGVAGAGAGALLCDSTDKAPPVRAMAEPADSDGDGITDDSDRCPGTPGGAEVDMRGCALDSDGDGVANYADDCPGTPTGVVVDDAGCPVKDEVVLTVDRLGFAYDSYALDARSRAALDDAFDVIDAHSSVQMDVVGYTDSRGTEEYNMKLSQRRAQAAVDYLVGKGIPASQLRAVGRGESSPVASNDTEDGRARNRRVELVVR